MIPIGERLRAWRKYRGLTLADLAESAKIGEATLSKIERGLQGVRAAQLEAMTERLSTSMVEFYSRIPDGDEPQAANG